MRDYGRVYSTFWSSETTAGLSADGKLLALYLLTCPHATIAGVFRLPDGYVAEDLAWSSERVAEGFRELFAKGFANRCETTKWVWVTKHLEWNPPENPNQRKAAVKVALSVPDSCDWKPDFMRASAEVLALPVPEQPNPSGTVAKPFRNQEQEQEQKQKQESVASKPRPAKKAPPDFVLTDDMRQWAATDCPGIDVEAETAKFRDHTFGTARTDWLGTWRNWMRRATETAAGRRPVQRAANDHPAWEGVE